MIRKLFAVGFLTVVAVAVATAVLTPNFGQKAADFGARTLMTVVK
ncbi:MAG: hypothetical protein Q7R93_02385 [bacterium]|nr:hypothetical protein [bacterium]